MALEAKAGEYVIVAKRKGDKWFIGGMTNNGKKEREFTIKLDFLNKDRSYQMTSFEDGINAGRQAMDYRRENGFRIVHIQLSYALYGVIRRQFRIQRAFRSRICIVENHRHQRVYRIYGG